jgi:hypothetical protein
MRIIFKLVSGFLLVALVMTSIRSQAESSLQAYRSNFRYLIISDVLLHNGRLVFALLDEKSFSEENLKELFRLISKRFPKPDELHVAVFTNLEQVETPEEADFYKGLSPEIEIPSNVNVDRYPSATYVRSKGNESFSYSVVSPIRVEKTIIIKGEDLLHPKNKP